VIVRPLHPAETFYRFITPRWAHTPTSGAGAARFGGRFNRPGIKALYLSRHVETAAAEYQQDDPLIPPGTLVAYRVALSRVVDFQARYIRGLWDELWADWDCEWRGQAFHEEIEPPSWLFGDLAIMGTMAAHPLTFIIIGLLRSTLDPDELARQGTLKF